VIWMFAILGSFLTSMFRYATTDSTFAEETQIFGISLVILLIAFVLIETYKIMVKKDG
jgi:hypothetical protein